jgi:hypothetical protein
LPFFRECSAAILSALSVAPFISMVDKAIVSNASGLEPLVPSLVNSFKGFVSSPLTFLRQPSFLLIWGVYGGTYCAANTVEAICEMREQPALYPKLVGSSVANVSLSVMKDKAFAKMFAIDAGSAATKIVPPTCYALWATRDTMTIFASFTLPPIAAKKFNVSDTTAQLICPCAMQVSNLS